MRLATFYVVSKAFRSRWPSNGGIPQAID